MHKFFNTDGYCDPELNYMVDLSGRLAEIKKMVDAGKYFTINKARQYGKTTADYLKADYDVISLDFQGLSNADFETEQSFCAAFSREVLDMMENLPEGVREKLEIYSAGNVREVTLSVLFRTLADLCRIWEKRIVLIIDEVDVVSNNQIFIDFLSQLRFYYLRRRKTRTFQSVILAGVYDVRSVKNKIRPDQDHKENSPWNIASDFLVDMSFSAGEIAMMLEEYERDHCAGMDISQIAELIYRYTSGYPYLVSRLCKLRAVLYNYFLAEEFADSKMYNAGLQEKNRFIVGGHLDVRRVLEKFVETFDELYGDQDETFLEEAGRRYFILFLKPIINGTGSYSVESQTRNKERMDIVIHYRGEQYVIELKIWRGNAYHERGEKQLSNSVLKPRQVSPDPAGASLSDINYAFSLFYPAESYSGNDKFG